MPTRIIREPEHVDALAIFLKGLKLPITVSWTVGAPKKDSQNRLSQRWFTDITTQLGDRDREYVRSECKLRFGVPILREENVAFREKYDRILKPLSYEEKIEAITVFDLPVTRLMTTKQMSKFMDNMSRHWISAGVRLTDPEDLIYQEEFR
jgi:hypothetical protein